MGDKTWPEIREEVLKLSHNEENVGMFWKLIYFPIHPEFYRYTEEEQEKLVKLSWKLYYRGDVETPEYPEDIKELASGSPSPRSGKHYDIVSLLSSFGGRDLIRNNGDRVALNQETFKGKYVLVYCINSPVIRGHGKTHQLVNLYNELYSTRDDFAMVMVARMKTLGNDCEVFDHFFSGFPESCLAVPFEDNQRRDYICKVLNLGLDTKRDHNCFQCLFLNPEGRVLPSLNIYPDKLKHYGAEAFPFKKENIYQSDVECWELIFGDASLERILRCDDFSPDFVYKINNPREEVPISQLSNEVKNKHVGLYLCSGGEFLYDLLDMYEQCREKQLEFEIVVVYLPFKEQLDPKIFQEKIDGLLHKHSVMGWWCLPFNNSVSRRFWRLTQEYDTENGEGIGPYLDDKLIVVGPGVDHLNMYGDCVIRNQGIDAFPFTIEAAIQVRMKQLQEITLESLFADDDDVLFFRGDDRNDVVSVKDFQDIQIFLCIDKLLAYEDRYDCSRSQRLESIYNEMKAMDGRSFEVVFVEVGGDSVVVGEMRDRILSEMPWYVSPKNGTNSTNLEELMRLLNGRRDVLVGFGEDGRVSSVQRIQDFVYSDVEFKTTEEFSLGDTLYSDVERILGYHWFCDHRMQKFADPEEDWRSRYGDDFM